MTKKNYRDLNCDLDALLKDIKAWFDNQGYETQTSQTDDSRFLQAAKTKTWRKVVGASRAFNVLIQGESNNFSVDLSTGEWASNLAAGGVAALLTGGATLLISGATASWSKKIEVDLWNFIEGLVRFGERTKSAQASYVMEYQNETEQKLKQLEEAYKQGFIDKTAYNSKRADIEKQMESTKQNAETEEKLLKLKGLLEAGILTQSEFEAKKAELIPNFVSSDLEAKISKLNTALAAGILTQEEYETKKAEIEKQFKISARLKQLKEAKEAGIITEEEFQQKEQDLMN